MKTILISGKAKHGKDTFAEMLKHDLEYAGKKVIIAHFADLLKYVCKTFYMWDGDKTSNKGRELLQHVGTDIVRNQYPTYWCDFLKFWLCQVSDLYDYVIIPDTRFHNEIEAFKGSDTVSIRVTRLGDYEDTAISNMTHSSEIDLDDYEDWDYVIVNRSGNLTNLRNKSYLVCNELLATDN